MRRLCRTALQLRLSSTCSPSAAGPSQSIATQPQRRSTVAVAMSAQDEKLIQRGEFYGVAPAIRRREEEMRSPELALSRMHEQLRRNFRVSPENVMLELVLRLEGGDASLLSLLRRAGDRWIPMSIRCCGRALSSIQMESRREITKRLWEQIEKRDLPISIESINALLRVKLDNNEEWCPWKTLKEIEETRGLSPDQETFQLLLEKLSRTGAIDQCNKMLQVYEMARRGHSASDPIAHSHLVYANAVRGHNRKVDSMIEHASTKFGSEGEAISLGAACVAAAAGERMDRLRELLRRSVDDRLRLRLPIESLFEIIWVLSEKSADNETRNDAFMEELLSRSAHPNGFFRFLYREIERHISSTHFRSAMVLMGETMRVREALQNQDRNAFSEQMVGKMCRAMVRSRMKKEEMMEMANRMETTLHMRSRFIHDELMMAVLTMKDSDVDDRFSFFSFLLPVVDPKRERPHIILPFLAVSQQTNDRLSLIFRASSLGYSNLELLDSNLMAEYLFQPMYKYQSYLIRQRNVGGKSAMEKMSEIIHSFGVPMESIWRMMYGWWTLKKDREREMDREMRDLPNADDIQLWLRSEYSTIFTDRAKESMPSVPLSKTRLQNAIEKGETSTILSLLSSHGWPSDVALHSTAPKILELLLQSKESSANISKWLNAISRESSCRRERGVEEKKSPLESNHLLKVINHRAKETRMPAKELIEMAYELKRLFPHAVVNYDSAPNAIHETNHLISNCFIFKEGTQLTMTVVDDIIELVRTLIKLDIVGLSQHGETVSLFCVHKVLQRFGWNSAVKLWLRFQSSFSFGNGMLILLSHSLKSNANKALAKESIQFVLHKAHTCLPLSRIHSLYAAMQVNTGKMEDGAEEYFKEHGSEMTPFDCSLAYKLTNALRFPPMDKYFIRTFPALCLSHTPLAENKDEARNMLHTSLRFCEMKRQGPLIVEMCDLFAQFGVEPDENEKRRVERAMEEHQKLVNQWIFSPDGLVQAKPDDEFIKDDEWKKYVRGMNITPENTVVRL